ncbi:MAG: methyltransferase domain-containing protein [Chloroflexi bacterium]|nr:methyltransferase domain-containing protein [Chloroflexota bacterium]
MKRTTFELLVCPSCHGNLESYCADLNADPCLTGNLYCKTCAANYSILEGISYFIEPKKLIHSNRLFSHLRNWFSWGYAPFSKVAFAYIGMDEATGRREITDQLEPRGGKVLDVSVGSGVNLPYLVRRQDVGEVFGMDTSPWKLKRCQSLLRKKCWAVDLFLGNEEQLPFKDASFDSIFHIGGINSINNKKAAIDEMIRVAKPGARVLIAAETEKGALGYEKIFQGFKNEFGGSRELIAPPIDLVPSRMLETRIFEVWKGWLYCLEFRMPS